MTFISLKCWTFQSNSVFTILRFFLSNIKFVDILINKGKKKRKMLSFTNVQAFGNRKYIPFYKGNILPCLKLIANVYSVFYFLCYRNRMLHVHFQRYGIDCSKWLLKVGLSVKCVMSSITRVLTEYHHHTNIQNNFFSFGCVRQTLKFTFALKNEKCNFCFIFLQYQLKNNDISKQTRFDITICNSCQSLSVCKEMMQKDFLKNVAKRIKKAVLVKLSNNGLT